MQSQLFLNSKPGLHNHTNLQVDEVNNYAPCVLDIDIEKGMAESIKSDDKTVGNLKSDDSLPVRLFVPVAYAFMAVCPWKCYLIRKVVLCSH